VQFDDTSNQIVETQDSQAKTIPVRDDVEEPLQVPAEATVGKDAHSTLPHHHVITRTTSESAGLRLSNKAVEKSYKLVKPAL
jgi:hypothetical protein